MTWADRRKNNAILLQFPVRNLCDHGRSQNCPTCELLNFRRGLRNALLLAIGFWSLAGLIAIWWFR